MLKKLMLTLIGGLFIMTSSNADAADSNIINMEVSSGGTVVIKLMPDIAPKHAARIKKLANEGFYDGIIFHRVIENFMAQTGDPTGTGTSGSKYPDLPAEFSNYTFKRGTVGMARTMNPDSANSQFFICFTDYKCRGLTGSYTVVGQVEDGMEFVDKLAVGEPPSNPDKIIKMTVGSDKETPAPEKDAKKAAE